MTRLRKAIHTFVNEKRKLYHNYSISPIPQKLIASYGIRGLAVPRAGDTSFVTVSIHGGSQSHLTYTVAHPGFGKEPPTNFCGFHIKNTHFSTLFYRKRACSECSHYKPDMGKLRPAGPFILARRHLHKLKLPPSIERKTFFLSFRDHGWQ